MTEKIISDKNLIAKVVGSLGRGTKTLLIQYDKKSNKAFYKTDTMIHRKPIHTSSVKDL